MTGAGAAIPPEDLDLLSAIDREGSVAAAARRLGIPRDRAVYRIARLRRRLRGSVLVPHRGGAAHGSSRLTAPARRLLAERPPDVRTGRPDRIAGARLVGTFHAAPSPTVRVGSVEIFVDFRATDGERVGVEIPPEAVVLALGRFASSARNIWPGRVVRVEARRRGPARQFVRIRALGRELPVAVTPSAVAELALRPGRRIFLYAKATALRRAPPYSRIPSVVSE